MKHSLPGKIAWRYLISKKSRGAVGVLTVIAVCGIAVSTAAIICVLSVFNGFKGILKEKNPGLKPDIEIISSHGKAINSPDSVISIVRGVCADSKGIIPIVRDNALIVFNGVEMPVTIMGVDGEVYKKLSGIERYVFEDGKFQIGPAETEIPASGVSPLEPDGGFSEEALLEELEESNVIQDIAASIGVAGRLGIHPGDSDITIFTPSRTRSINPANPLNSFEIANARLSSVYSTRDEDYDREMIFCDTELARSLFEYDSEATLIAVWLKDPADAPKVAEKIQASLGERFTVRDRARLNEVSFRMIQIEKWVTFLLLAFILMIAFFNVISSLSILVSDKIENLLTLRILGFTAKDAGRIFTAESFLVALTGGISGIGLGALLCFLQSHFKLIKLNGDADALLIPYYPVEIELSDILGTMLLVCALGLITAVIISAYTRRKVSRTFNR